MQRIDGRCEASSIKLSTVHYFSNSSAGHDELLCILHKGMVSVL